MEQGTPKSTHSTGALIVGVGKFRTFTEISGLRSSTRLTAGHPQTFIIGTSAAVPLPQNVENVIYAVLQKFEVNKRAGTREWLFASTTGGYVYTKSKGATSPLGIPLDFTRYDDHSIKIQPRAALASGEYGFSVQPTKRDPYAGDQVYYRSFGVD
jgi:hypothetical protein